MTREEGIRQAREIEKAWITKDGVDLRFGVRQIETGLISSWPRGSWITVGEHAEVVAACPTREAAEAAEAARRLLSGEAAAGLATRTSVLRAAIGEGLEKMTEKWGSGNAPAAPSKRKVLK